MLLELQEHNRCWTNATKFLTNPRLDLLGLDLLITSIIVI